MQNRLFRLRTIFIYRRSQRTQAGPAPSSGSGCCTWWSLRPAV